MSATMSAPRPSAFTSSTDRMIARVMEGVVHVEAGGDGGAPGARGVRIDPRRMPHSGAGVVWARDTRGALIVSNAHVVTREPVRVSGQDGVAHAATLVARDAVRDVALLWCETVPEPWRPVPPPTRGTTLRAGQVVMAVGHPMGVRHAVTTGVIHAVGPLTSDIALPAPQRALNWAQLDLALAPGNSGGPVVDAHGHLIGISTMIARGLGLAIPVAEVDQFVFAAAGPARLAYGWTRDA